MYNVYCTISIMHYSMLLDACLFNIQVQCTMYDVQCIMYIVQYTLCNTLCLWTYVYRLYFSVFFCRLNFLRQQINAMNR